ncbi:MAG: sel1 repeat family protein [Proteobacteria bacterium]|nr:MAG: sel1 repeat family protein [Pseudomonadota bacterium]
MCRLKTSANTTARECGASGAPLLGVSSFAGLVLAVACIFTSATAHASLAFTNDLTASAHETALTARQISFENLTKDIRSTGLAAHRFRQAETALEQAQYEQAALRLQLLALQGHQNAQFLMGLVYGNGLGVGSDPKQAMHWYELAAKQGHIEAQYNLGVAYSTGKGVNPNNIKAAGWWRKAAMQGNTDAQFSLGLLYAQGQGVVKNLMEAARWWFQAASHGDPAAQYALGLMYVRGQGVSQDLNAAVKWWFLAASQGFERAQDALQMLQTLTIE